MTWILLLLIVDREGRALDNLVNLRSKVYPLREDVTLAMLSFAMRWFADRGMILRYTVENKRYLCIVNFVKYQGDTRRESVSLYPPASAGTAQCQSDSGVTQELCVTHSGVTRELLVTNSGATPELLVSNSRPDSDSDSDSNANANSEADADSKVKVSAYPDGDTDVKVSSYPDTHLDVQVSAYPGAKTTFTSGPSGSHSDQHCRLDDLRQKVRLVFVDSPICQSLLTDACNRYGLDELDLAVKEAILQGCIKWKYIIGTLRHWSRIKSKSTAPTLVA